MITTEPGRPTVQTRPRTVGVVGYGLLGQAFAERLAEAGHLVVGYDNVERQRSVMHSNNVIVKESVEEVAKLCDLVLICVYSSREVIQIASVIGNLSITDRRPGQQLIISTTLDPTLVPELVAIATERRLQLVEFPISGTSVEVLHGEAFGLFGGDDEQLKECESILKLLTPRLLRVGSLGSAAWVKLAINLVLEINRSAVAEGFRFAELANIDLEIFHKALSGSAAYSRVLDRKGLKIRTANYSPEGRVAQSLKDVMLLLASSRMHGQQLPLLEAQAGLLAGCVEHGEADQDSSIVIEELRRRQTGVAFARLTKMEG